MFKSAAAGLLFSPKDGDSVLAYGRISVYVPGGAYQLYIDMMTPEGVGDLHQQFLLLQKKEAAMHHTPETDLWYGTRFRGYRSVH